jgi:hypothetical protein
VACGAGAQLPIPAFDGSVAREGHDPIGRPVADVVSKRFNAAEFSFLKKPAQVTTHIRLGDSGRTPNLLADVVKTLGASRLPAGKNDAAVLNRRSADYAPALRDSPEFRYNTRGIAERLKHRVTENRIKRGGAKWQPSTIGDGQSEIAPPS